MSGGYGVLGIVVAYLIWTQASWSAYFIGVFVIGIADLVLVITPFGMPSLTWKLN